MSNLFDNASNLYNNLSNFKDGVDFASNLHNAAQENLAKHPYKHLVETLSLKMNDPATSPAEKIELAKKIAEIESRGASQVKKMHLYQAASIVAKKASYELFGPLGVGICTFGLRHYDKEFSEEKSVQEARTVGGRRVSKKNKRPKKEKTVLSVANKVLNISNIKKELTARISDLSSYAFSYLDNISG